MLYALGRVVEQRRLQSMLSMAGAIVAAFNEKAVKELRGALDKTMRRDGQFRPEMREYPPLFKMQVPADAPVFVTGKRSGYRQVHMPADAQASIDKLRARMQESG